MRFCPYCQHEFLINRPLPDPDVVKVLAEDVPKGNTTVACPECKKTHPWPVCRDDELEWRKAVIDLLRMMNVSHAVNHRIADLRSRLLA
jgi:hypothetical protein